MTDAVALSVASQRAAAEQALVALTFASPRCAVEILKSLGVSGATISQPDLLAIFCAIELVTERTQGPVDTIRIAMIARTVLRSINHWDDNDHRRFVSGSVWSPESLAALAHRAVFDRKRLRTIAIELLRLDHLEHQLAAAPQRAAS
jgi:hypothetical protein